MNVVMQRVTPPTAIMLPEDKERADQEKEERMLANTRAHACQMPGQLHFYGNDNRCVFCNGHRPPVFR